MFYTDSRNLFLFLTVLPLFLTATFLPVISQEKDTADEKTEVFQVSISRTTNTLQEFDFRAQPSKVRDHLILKTKRKIRKPEKKGGVPDIPGEESKSTGTDKSGKSKEESNGVRTLEAKILKWTLDIDAAGLKPPSMEPFNTAVKKIINKPFKITVEKDGLVLFGPRLKSYLKKARNIYHTMSVRERVRQKKIDKGVRGNGGYAGDLYKKYRYKSWELREKFVKNYIFQPDYFRHLISPGWVRPVSKKMEKTFYSSPIGRVLLMDNYENWDAKDYGTFPAPCKFSYLNGNKKDNHLFLRYRIDSDLFLNPEKENTLEPSYEKKTGTLVVRKDGTVVSFQNERTKNRGSERFTFKYQLNRSRRNK